MELDIIRRDVLGEVLYGYRATGGLRTFILPRRGYARKYANLAAHYGSVDSTFIVPGENEPWTVPEGIAHFLEHKLFEKEEGDAFERFAALGAYSNAYTSYNMTAYHIHTTDEFLPALDILLDFVQSPYFSAEGVEKEKDIIQQEIRMLNDNPRWRVINNLLGALYHVHPVRHDIGGTVESIRRITPGYLRRCYDTFYHPSNMALFIAGDVDPVQVASLVEDSQKKRGYADRGPIERILPDEPPGIVRERVEEQMAVSLPLVALGFKDSSIDERGEDLFRKDIVTTLALELWIGKSSPLFAELEAEGLIDDRFSARYMGDIGYGASVLSGESRDPARLHDRLLSSLDDLARDGPDPVVLERLKRKELGEFIGLFNELDDLAYGFLATQFQGANFLDLMRILDTITVEDVRTRIQAHLAGGNRALSVIEPQRR